MARSPARKIRLSSKRREYADQRAGGVFVGKPLSPPDAVEARYAKALAKMTDRMTAQVSRELRRLYRSPGAPVATDASFASQASQLVAAMQSKFDVLFSKAAGGLAKSLMSGISDQTATSLGASLKDLSGGVTLKTDVVSGAVADMVTASIKSNVALIKSIPSEFFQDIEGAVMRSIQTGRGMADLDPYLVDKTKATKKRAALIARDQTSKATTAINQARMKGLGVKKFRWLHSAGGKDPRPLHKDVLNGNIYELDNPPIIDDRTGERGLPGQLINCFTGSTKVSLANGCRNLWRYWHSGDIIRIGVMGNTTIEATPNHPILTGRGWLPAHEIQEGDYLASSVENGERVIDGHDAQSAVTFADLYIALVSAGDAKRSAGAEFNFHGDVPENEVDCVGVKEDLSLRLKTGGAQEVEKLILAATNGGGFDASPGVGPEVFHSLGSGARGQCGPFASGEFAHADTTGAATVPQNDAVLGQHIADDLPGALVDPGNLQDAGAPLVKRDNISGTLAANAGGFLGRDFVLEAALEGAGNVPGADFVALAKLAESNPAIKGFHRVEKKGIIVFTGHVYTMETFEGWYSVALTGTISKNCRCRMVPVIEFGDAD